MAGPGIINPSTPDTGNLIISNLTETPNSISYFGMKSYDRVVGRPLQNVYSFSGTISNNTQLSSLVSIPASTKFAIIQGFTTAFTISQSASSFGGLYFQGNQIVTLPMSMNQLNSLYLNVSGSTSFVIETFDYDGI